MNLSFGSSIDITYTLFNSIEICDLDHIRVDEDFDVINSDENVSTKRVKTRHPHEHQNLCLSLGDGWNALHIASQQVNPFIVMELLHRLDVMASTRCHSLATTASNESAPVRDFRIDDLLFQQNDIGEIPIMSCLRMMQFSNSNIVYSPLFDNGLKVCSHLLQRMILSLERHLEKTNQTHETRNFTTCCFLPTTTMPPFHISNENDHNSLPLMILRASNVHWPRTNSTSSAPSHQHDYSNDNIVMLATGKDQHATRALQRDTTLPHQNQQHLKVIPTLLAILNLLKNSNGMNSFQLATSFGMDLLSLIHGEAFECSLRKKLFQQQQQNKCCIDIQILFWDTNPEKQKPCATSRAPQFRNQNW
nr:unnamed protein product [Naegleria fowleri]